MTKPQSTSFSEYAGCDKSKPVRLPLGGRLFYQQCQTMLAADAPINMLVFGWTYDGTFDETAMAEAVQRYSRACLLLRIHVDEQGMMHEVAPAGFALETVAAEDLEAEFARWERQPSSADEPSTSFRFFELGGDKWTIAMKTTHEIIDAAALGMIVNGLAEYYGRVLAGEAEEPFAGPDFMDFSAWHADLLANGGLDESRLFWENLLREARPVSGLPMEPDSSLHPLAGVRASFPISEELADRCEALARDAGCSRFEGYLTFVNMLMARLSGQEEVLTAFITSLRRYPEFRDIVGFMGNRAYLPIHVGPDDSFGEVGKRVHSLLSEIKEELLWPAWESMDPMGKGVPGVFFHYVGEQPVICPEFEGLTNTGLRFDSQEYSPLPLILQVRRGDGKSMLAGMSQAGVCSEDSLQGLLSQLANLMEEVAGMSDTEDGNL